MLDRRFFLAGAAIAGAALPALATLSGRARAQDGHEPVPARRPNAAGRTQAPAFHRIRLGDSLVTVINDGTITLPPAVLPNVSAEEFGAAMRASFLPEDGYVTHINTFVVEDGSRAVLVDAGAPAAMGDTVGKLIANLAAAGYAPADFSHVLLTHMHGDHIGSMVDAAGTAAFPNAEIVVRDRELAFWTDPAQADTIPAMQQDFATLAKAVAAAYEGRVTPFAEDVAVLDGIEAVALYGHTPGHTGYRITAGPGLLIWGDLMHVAPVQMGKPEVFIGFDISPEEAVATRRRLLAEVAEGRTLVAGMHLPFPAFNHIVAEGAGYRFVPAPIDFAL